MFRTSLTAFSVDLLNSKVISVCLKYSRFQLIKKKIVFPLAVDGSRAGSGNLEILVNGGRVTSSVRALGSQRFIASFTSHEAGMHTVQITFNGETVPGKNKFDEQKNLLNN